MRLITVVTLLALAASTLALPTKMRKLEGDDHDGHDHDEHDEASGEDPHAGHDHSGEEEEIEVKMTLSGEIGDYGSAEVTASASSLRLSCILALSEGLFP